MLDSIVPRKPEPKPSGPAPADGKRVSLKVLGEYLGLSPATISLVLNNSPVAQSIPPATRQRVLAAAEKFNYRPNPLARSLRMNRTHTVGIIAPEHSEGYFTGLMMAIESYLIQAGYLYFTVSHLGRKELLSEYTRMLVNRQVDGVLLINTRLPEALPIPTVAISSHSLHKNVIDVLLDHDAAAQETMQHLYDLGHRRIAFMRGQPEALDSQYRWEATLRAAKALGLTVDESLCIAIAHNSWSPDLGYEPVLNLLDRTRDFTALVCFNDLAAIGAFRAVADRGLSCPQDLSIIGFDDIAAAGYSIPRLSTVRQPLQQMGEAAARVLIEAIESKPHEQELCFAPELIERDSTAARSTPLRKVSAKKSARS
ncbi:LacI family DNA-binding transcriptional regulator [Granulicella cerasi]|uniref:LacI family DNA-binding transcriptional regulator n=1 Tax=Granulicella cerasi TaxID=741063 RepID=A0ABW1ZA36_9BACT|nr:LacI family DNA-binding transcriptional regulator [Granulicella cerasi]